MSPTVIPRQVKQEIRFGGLLPIHRCRISAIAVEAEITAYTAAHLPVRVDIWPLEPTPQVDRTRYGKASLRRWLNRHCQGLWTYTATGVAFADERDGFFFKLYWK